MVCQLGTHSSHAFHPSRPYKARPLAYTQCMKRSSLIGRLPRLRVHRGGVPCCLLSPWYVCSNSTSVATMWDYI